MAQTAAHQKTEVRVSGRVLCLVAVIILMPFPIVAKDWSSSSLRYDYSTLLFPVDIGLVALLAMSAWPITRSVRDRQVSAGWTGWLGLSLVLGAAWVVHPSGRGAMLLIEMFGAVAIAQTIATADDAGKRVIWWTVALLAGMETTWAVLQRVTLGSLGLQRLGETDKPLYRFGPGAIAAQGSMLHIYILAGLALLVGAILAATALKASRPRPWMVGAAVAVVPVGFTYSRAGLLSLVLVVAAIALSAAPPIKRRSVLVASSLLIGAAIPALAWNGGWRSRAAQSTAVSKGAAAVTTDRGQLDREAMKTIAAYPILGVGPGRYVMQLKQRYGQESNKRVGIFKPVHDIPLLTAAEGGVLAGLVLVGMLALVGWRAVRTGSGALAVYLSYLPFFLLDHFAYTFPQGLVLTGIWLGVLDLMARTSRTALAPQGQP